MSTSVSESFYIQSATTLKEKIVKICDLITALEDLAVSSVSNETTSEYWLNDGQTSIKRVYRGLAEIEASITAYERLLQRYINRLNGPISILKDRESLRIRRR